MVQNKPGEDIYKIYFSSTLKINSDYHGFEIDLIVHVRILPINGTCSLFHFEPIAITNYYLQFQHYDILIYIINNSHLYVSPFMYENEYDLIKSTLLHSTIYSNDF